jgi:hypothetical protein
MITSQLYCYNYDNYFIIISLLLQHQLYRLGPLSCSNSELSSESRIYKTFGRNPWKGDRPIARPLCTLKKKNANEYPCSEWDSNP